MCVVRMDMDRMDSDIKLTYPVFCFFLCMNTSSMEIKSRSLRLSLLVVYNVIT